MGNTDDGNGEGPAIGLAGSGGAGRGPPRFDANRLRLILIVALAVPLAALAWTTFHAVPSDSVAVVQRFGKYRGTTPAGLHLELPIGVDEITIVPVERQLKQEFGFGTPGATDPHQGSRTHDANDETQMVTGDLNAALVEWVVQYRISDPAKFLCEVREPNGTLRHVSESVRREFVGDRTVDEVITVGRQEIEIEALTESQSLSTRYAMGISIDQVQLENINPPRPVQDSFNEVSQAQQEKEELINEARRDCNEVIPLAEGEKDQRIREADGYRLKRINYNESVRPKIYDRMVSERRQIAERFLSEGNGEAARIRGNRVRELDEIQSEAYRSVEEIRGLADARATEIHAQAHAQSAAAAKLYRFTRTMQAYRSVIDERTTLVLSTDSELFGFLNAMGPNPAGRPE